MISIDEMRKLLSEKFGIKSDEDLDRELKKLGGIRIGVFVDKAESQDKKVQATA